jgi:WD40 repeat protein
VGLGSQRILCISWHPTVKNMFAVGSFDNSVYSCTLDESNNIDITHLVYHTDRVRSLSWNSEIPWLLISASDDQQIVLWDVRTGTCLASFIEPSLALT